MPTYSSRGPTWYDGYAKLDIVAPGDELISDTGTPRGLYGRYPGLRQMAVKGYYYMALSGTSMATGVAAGVVAHVPRRIGTRTGVARN